MRLFKYRSLKGDGLLHALDMIVNRRIYLSTLDALNDPDEGAFKIQDQRRLTKAHGEAFLQDMASLRTRIDKTRFTSFATKADNPLLWAHYAGGYSGVAFEYDLPDDDSTIDLLPIQYIGTPLISHDTCKKIINDEEPLYKCGILRSKRAEWEYESEYRLYLKSSKDSYLDRIAPKSVVIGGRKRRNDSVFEQVCKKYKIKVGSLLELNEGYEVFYPTTI